MKKSFILILTTALLLSAMTSQAAESVKITVSNPTAGARMEMVDVYA
ncbi:MAG: hypothetical protein K2I99_08335 [Bacteroidaceae bacterium]|nr:hypothetical protein [Bacteroidaceae bacterium]